MDVREAIQSRRAYRSLEPVKITQELIEDLAECAQLAPSCFNYQPWNYIFIHDPEVLEELKTALSKGNNWAHEASMIIVVFSRSDLDCVIKEREYYLFDTGMATANIILRATELGLVAHPIAGYSPSKVREVLGIPDEMNVINLIIIGKHSETVNPSLSEDQAEIENKRPERKQLNEFIHMNIYKND